MADAQLVDIKVRENGKHVMSLENSPLYEGLLYAAHLLSGEQRLELIKDLQTVQAELEARFR
ncbi:hypothetical protein SJI00_02805 [Pseudomonas sp. RP23018S]|uniref:hypothetical protein n=1 Tax=Pseudomonas sp. RP23018S TaxID=3096037 RepID=UPI002ACA0609|nr:hypothetical protein [Pseudomonas sp. RP23018S]MDZ5601708.1 hypothetical protein [Pseudomonas sp. RP23018S]